MLPPLEHLPLPPQLLLRLLGPPIWRFLLQQMPPLPVPWPPHLQPLPLFLPMLRLHRPLPPLPLVVLGFMLQPWMQPRLPPLSLQPPRLPMLLPLQPGAL